MTTGLVNAETEYYKSLRNAIKYKINVNKALNDNQMYYERLFDFYKRTDNIEDKNELAFELDYLIRQAVTLKNTQLNQAEETA